MSTKRSLLDQPVRLGIIGCGSFVIRRILPALQEVKELCVVAIQKRDLDEARKVASAYAIPHAVTDRRGILQREDVEAVLVASPNHLHEEDALACAAAGKVTLCEKPLAPTVSAVKRMISAFQELSIPFYVGHSLRFKPSIKRAKELVQTGAIGELLAVKVHYCVPLPPENWRFSKKSGGGVLQDLGIHLVDLVHFVTGQTIEVITAQTQGEEVEHTAVAIGRLSGGATVTLECSFRQPLRSGFEFIGSQARIISSESLRQTMDPVETLSIAHKDGRKEFLPLIASNVYVEEMRHFAEIVAQPGPSPILAEIGLTNQCVIEAALASSRECTSWKLLSV